MSEIDDLMVSVMLHQGDDAEFAIVRLINLTETGEATDKERRHIMKAVERRLKKERSGTDIYDLLTRLSNIIDPSAKHESNELLPEMESPDAVLARRLRGESAPAKSESPEPKQEQSDSHNDVDYQQKAPPEYYHPEWTKQQKNKNKKNKSDADET